MERTFLSLSPISRNRQQAWQRLQNGLNTSTKTLHVEKSWNRITRSKTCSGVRTSKRRQTGCDATSTTLSTRRIAQWTAAVCLYLSADPRKCVSDICLSHNTAEDDAYEGSSEAGTDSAESLKVLISSPVKRPSVPLAWQTRIAEIAVFKPANANVFQPSCSPSCSDSVDNKHTLSALQAVAEQQSQIEHVPPASESPAIPSSSTAELSVSKTSHASRELQSVANDTSFLIPASKAQPSDPVLLDQTHDWPCEKATLFPASNRASSCLKTTILQISNSPFKVTSEELLDWLGEEVKDSLPDPSQQIVSVHVLCDRFKGMTKRPAYVEVLDEKIAEKVKNEKWGKEFQGRKIKIAFSSRRAMLCNVCAAPFFAQGLSG